MTWEELYTAIPEGHELIITMRKQTWYDHTVEVEFSECHGISRKRTTRIVTIELLDHVKISIPSLLAHVMDEARRRMKKL